MKTSFLSISCIAIILFINITCLAQQSEEPEMKPEETEIWEPEPAVVTPGMSTNSAPSDAIVLFDGSDLSQWVDKDGNAPGWEVMDGAVTVVKGTELIKTKAGFGNVQLHIEWMTPSEVVGNSQDRGNSGIFLQGLYELQVLDSYNNRTYSNGQAGSIYKQHIPLVNASRAPGEWQAYDIIYRAPVFNNKGDLTKPASITVLHNGVLVQDNVVLRGPTGYIGIPQYKAHAAKLPLMLQDHSNPVSYRNIWIREL